ncbi:LysR family transcriptional regulator [Actinospongicola halichondriae]|uniref:LysR family transcriptional regulator n=1 Tax=Actinospongicola halichondriae TaxID=3236844 RepID=UPI003D4E2683
MSALKDVDIRHLAALAAVVDEGSFAKAAQALGFTQSAISQQIAALEKAAGLPVLDRPRGPKAAELTPAGELLLGYAREVLSRVEEMDDELDRLRRGISGRLVIGTFQSVSGKVLPPLIGRMRTEVPDVDIRLFETDDQTALIRGILDDDLDLAFTVDAEPDPRLESVHLGYDPFVVLAAKGEIEGPTAAPADLTGHPMIGQPAANVCQMLIDRRLDAVGVRPDYVFRSQDNGAVQGMVRSGMGRAIMPYLAIDPDDPGVDVLELDPPVDPRRIQLTRRTDRSLPPAADHFATLAREVGAAVLQPENTLVD